MVTQKWKYTKDCTGKLEAEIKTPIGIIRIHHNPFSKGGFYAVYGERYHKQTICWRKTFKSCKKSVLPILTKRFTKTLEILRLDSEDNA